ncbi:MAG: hypothetical protein JO079_11340 [Frankiaceae bacterium]|nr:hypothetical protein [Frankiaceae bacterium]MBV9369795.1 hypothetical protein [Frankiales bacterium]
MSGHRRWIRRESAPRQAVQPESRGTEALDELLGEVRELRMTFVTDLSTAAGAVEAGAPEIAADILDADRAELARFFEIADERLRELERAALREVPRTDGVGSNVVPLTPRSRTRRRVAVALPAIPLVGALTMAAAAAAGVLPIPGTSPSTSTSHHGPATVAAAESNALAQFATVVNSDPSAQQVIDAADKLHQQIVAMMATSHGDPAQANAIAQLLQAERDLLLRAQPPGAQAVLAATSSLITQLKGHVKPSATPLFATPNAVDVAPKPTSTTSPKSSPSPSPSKTAKPSPSPTHSSSPSPSSSSSNPPGPLPKVGG